MYLDIYIYTRYAYIVAIASMEKKVGRQVLPRCEGSPAAHRARLHPASLRTTLL